MNTNARSPVAKPLVKHKFSLVLYVIFWAMILTMFGAMIITQAGRYNQLRADFARIDGDVARERAIYHDLNNQLLFFDSDTYIETLARERLGMIRPNEIVFRNIAE